MHNRIRSYIDRAAHFLQALFLTGLLLTVAFHHSEARAKLGGCNFDKDDLTFQGNVTEQALCLLRPVMQGGKPGPALSALPSPLDRLVGTAVQISKDSLRAYLSQKGIAEDSVGGDLGRPVSTAANNSDPAHPAQYFVIHDTSTPNCSEPGLCSVCGRFPSEMNAESWSYNNRTLVRFSKDKEPVAHVFVGRTGISKLGHDFSTPWRAVKVELKNPGGPADPSKGRFLHVETVQPRLNRPTSAKPDGCDTPGPDLIAPAPGFTTAQYARLALVYVAASVRRGEWLIPAFHANIDRGYSDGHDDPQNFDLAQWAGELDKALTEIGNQKSAQADSGTAVAADREASGIRKTSCASDSYEVTLQRAEQKVVVALPAEGRFFGEGHYVTTADRFPSGRKYPDPMVPQPARYSPPVQCDEAIGAHIARSLELYRGYDPSMTSERLYPDHWARWWTPEEGGHCGQGAIGEEQLRSLTPDKEMWFLTMNWASGHRPARDTRFLVSANGRTVVVVAGYETGPGGADKLGGVTREVHGWLGTNNSSRIKVSHLADQSIEPGPVDCR